MIVSMLLPAYLLLVLHSVIPHHHHAPAHHGPVHYHHGSHVHHAHHDHHPEGEHHEDHDHGPASHFVHAPDFGNAMLRSDADLVVEAPDQLQAPTISYCGQSANAFTRPRPDFPEILCRPTDETIQGYAGRGPPAA